MTTESCGGCGNCAQCVCAEMKGVLEDVYDYLRHDDRNEAVDVKNLLFRIEHALYPSDDS